MIPYSNRRFRASGTSETLAITAARDRNCNAIRMRSILSSAVVVFSDDVEVGDRVTVVQGR